VALFLELAGHALGAEIERPAIVLFETCSAFALSRPTDSSSRQRNLLCVKLQQPYSFVASAVALIATRVQAHRDFQFSSCQLFSRSWPFETARS